MASQKPVADTLADKFAKAQQRGKKDASKGSATRRTRSKGALEDSSSEEEVFQSPTGAAAAPQSQPRHFGREGWYFVRRFYLHVFWCNDRRFFPHKEEEERAQRREQRAARPR
jgi:hypothetical protein